MLVRISQNTSITILILSSNVEGDFFLLHLANVYYFDFQTSTLVKDTLKQVTYSFELLKKKKNRRKIYHNRVILVYGEINRIIDDGRNVLFTILNVRAVHLDDIIAPVAVTSVRHDAGLCLRVGLQCNGTAVVRVC